MRCPAKARRGSMLLHVTEEQRRQGGCSGLPMGGSVDWRPLATGDVGGSLGTNLSAVASAQAWPPRTHLDHDGAEPPPAPHSIAPSVTTSQKLS